MTKRESLLRDIEIAKDALFSIRSRSEYPARSQWLETCKQRLADYDAGNIDA